MTSPQTAQPTDGGLTTWRLRAIVLAAVVAGVAASLLALASDHQEAKAAFAIFGPRHFR